MISEIKLLTFKNFVNIVATTTETFDGYLLKEPCQVSLQPTKNDQLSVTFFPFLFHLTEQFSTGIPIPKSEVMCITNPTVDVINQYNQIFGSGISIARTMPNKIKL